MTTTVGARSRWLVFVAALSMMAASCGGGDSSSSGPGADAVSPDGGAEETGTGGDAGSVVEITAEAARVEFPPGVFLFDADNQTATLNAVAYVVTGRDDGMRLVAITEDGIADTTAFIAGAGGAEVFNSGTRIVMTGFDGVGNLVVLSSADGETFEEALIPVPQRYVDADVWQATSLVGDALGVADLDGDLFVIASVGVNWPSDLAVVARHAYSISEEIGDVTRFAGTVIQKPQGDGDFLYTFKVDGEVVFESLGSEAGLEPGYRQAVADASDDDKLFFGGWIVSGSTATETEEPPFGGGLAGDLRLKALYPVDGGVAAIVVDFSPEIEGGEEAASAGRPVLLSAHDSRPVPVTSHGVLADTLIYIFGPGAHTEIAGSPMGGFSLPDKVEVAFDLDSSIFVMIALDGGDVSVSKSNDGKDWERPPLRVDFSLPDGGSVNVETVKGAFVLIFPSSEPDGHPRMFKMTLAEDGLDNDMEEIDVETGEPIAFVEAPTSEPEIVRSYRNPFFGGDVEVLTALVKADSTAAREAILVGAILSGQDIDRLGPP